MASGPSPVEPLPWKRDHSHNVEQAVARRSGRPYVCPPASAVAVFSPLRPPPPRPGLVHLEACQPPGRTTDGAAFPSGCRRISLRKYTLPEAIRQVQGMGVHHVEFSAGTHLPATASDARIGEARTLAEAPG